MSKSKPRSPNSTINGATAKSMDQRSAVIELMNVLVKLIAKGPCASSLVRATFGYARHFQFTYQDQVITLILKYPY